MVTMSKVRGINADKTLQTQDEKTVQKLLGCLVKKITWQTWKHYSNPMTKDFP